MSYWPIGCFAGKKILISGGTSGIGAAIAKAFVEEGADVTVTGVTEQEIERAASEMPSVQCKILDVRDGEAVKSLIDDFEALHHVVNCAGVIMRNAELNPEVFQDVVDINLNGSMRICAAARPLLAESNGTIINTASMLSYFGGGLVPAYSASKGGITQMTKSLAIAYADDGIRVNAIAPGWIATDLTKGLQENKERSDAILSRTALKRWGKAGDLAGAAIFLASPIASFVTGTTVVVDGGYSIT
ncbi:MAG: SDR family oxidoreductase [Pseudomonadota bacterium]